MALPPFTSPAYTLIPASVAARLPRIGETSDQADPIVQVKWFTPDGGWTWFVVEYDPDSRIAYGLVEGLETEWGTFALDEIEQIRGALGLPVERDLHFEPRPVSQLKLRDQSFS